MSKKRDVRSQRDQAGIGPDARQVRHLRPISEMKKVRIASGEPDIRGWNVFTSTGREVGEVHDLLVDPSIGQVVMLDLDMAGTDRRSLAPIRAAWIDRETKRVVLDAAQISDDEILPSVTRGDTSDDERENEEIERKERQRRERDEEEREVELEEVRYDERALRAERPVVVEEHVVRRRIVEPDESGRTDV